MKKMMLLAGLLVLGTIGYAASVSTDTAEFKATVNVVSKVGVDATSIEFGNVAQGTTVTEKTKGTVTITGAANKNVRVEFLKGEAAWDGELTFTEEGLSGKAKVDTWNEGQYSKNIQLSKGGETKLELSGTINVGDQVTIGDKESDPITVKVTYEGLN